MVTNRTSSNSRGIPMTKSGHVTTAYTGYLVPVFHLSQAGEVGRSIRNHQILTLTILHIS